MAGVVLVAMGGLCGAEERSIREVDFRNLEYPREMADPAEKNVEWVSTKGWEMVRFVNGRWAVVESKFSFAGLSLEQVLYGDLTGDGKEEAVAVVRYDTGGTMNFHYLYVFSMQQERPRVVSVFRTGERAMFGLYDARISNRELIVELFDPEKETALCCSEGIQRTRYRWNGKGFEKVGAVVKAKARSVSRRPVDVFGVPVEKYQKR